jgi:hypothetical protein
VQRAIADDLREPAVEIDAGREAQVDTYGAKLGRHEPTARGGDFERELALFVVKPAERAERRQPHERLAEPLNTPAFLIDSHEQRRLTNRVDVGDELCELLDVREIARKKNDSAD